MINYQDLTQNDKTLLILPGDKITLEKYCDSFEDTIFNPDKEYEIEEIKVVSHCDFTPCVKLINFKNWIGLGWLSFTKRSEEKLKERFKEHIEKRSNEKLTHEQVTNWDTYEILQQKLKQIERPLTISTEFGDPVKTSEAYVKMFQYRGNRDKICIANFLGVNPINMNGGFHCAAEWLLFPNHYAKVLLEREICEKN